MFEKCGHLPPTLQSNHSHPSLTTHLRHREDDDDDAILYLIRRRHEARRRSAVFQFASLTPFHAPSPTVRPLSLALSCPHRISLKVPHEGFFRLLYPH